MGLKVAHTPLRYVVNRRGAPTVKGNLTLGYLKGGTYPFTLGQWRSQECRIGRALYIGFDMHAAEGSA